MLRINLLGRGGKGMYKMTAARKAALKKAQAASAAKRKRTGGVYWKEIGGYGGVIKVGNKWRRVDCASCAVTSGKAFNRWQGPPTKAMAKAYSGPVTIRLHNPKNKH
jgi:hypothetical protein